ncbi:MAG: thioesterase family protein [Cyanobacteria bacterium P01_H01_bin.15]
MTSTTSPKLNPTGALDPNPELQASADRWYELPIRVQPHHTDYSGNVWHGHYLTWLETARVECLRSLGIDFADLVAMGCDLPVVEMSLKYHRSLRLGQEAIVKTRLIQTKGVRMHWDYAISPLESSELYLTGRVTLVAVDREKGKIMRKLPPRVSEALNWFSQPTDA